MKNVIYISLDVVIAIHDDMVEHYGGSFGIRDINLIQSAFSRPQATFGGQDLYPTIFDKAAALFHSLLFNHAFVDANKRTAIVATARFLAINSYDFNLTDNEFVAFPLQVEKERTTLEEIASWLKKHAKKTVQESRKSKKK